MQQLLDSKPQSQPHSPHQSTKIKPLIFHAPKASYLCEPHIYTELKKGKKNLKTIRPSQPHYQSKLSHLSYFRKLTKILRTQNSLLELDYSSHPSEVFPNRYFFSKIRTLSSSSPLQLTLKSYFAQSELKTALKNLSSLKNLTHLNFVLPYDVEENPEALKTLFLTFARLKKLRSLSIDIHHLKDGKKISSYIAHLSQLRSLKLRTGGSNLSQFTSLLPNLPYLTQFTLYLYGTPAIPSEDFLAFYRGFQHTKALTDLTLDISGCSLSNPTDIEPFSEGLNALDPSLMKKLRLRLCSGIPAEGLIKVFEAIKKLTKLQTFDLRVSCFEANKITNSLSSALSELGSLKSLNIFIDALDGNKYAVLDIAAALESLQNLAYLELRFVEEDTTKDERIQKLSSSLKKLQGLQYLDLEFSRQKSISDLALESLSGVFKELMNLKNLSLIFGSTQGLTNEGIIAFCHAVKGLNKLTALTLFLEKGDIDEKAIGDIDEKAISEIAQMLREMPQLSEVYFSFDQCAKINNKETALASLFRALEESKNIKKTRLSLYDSKFNQKAVENLRLIKDVVSDFQPF